ncbi:MAG TPA: carboxypeptidase-like regulatory domain-containing protein, partial [Blastocatellia bacterium]|nr:carboxypeptidase-like regulatory domain-containing protein [Blastocatellia bacterium]
MQRERLPRLIIMTVIVSSALALGGQSVFAQLRITGRISGTVEDPSGAVVPHAKVVLKDLKTTITKETTSSDGGGFLFPDLASGEYEVTVSATGFQTAVLPNISVSTSHTTDVKVTLQVGQMSETVMVVGGDSKGLETSSQLVSTAIATKTVTELPVGNRSNVLALARLAPGAMPPTGGSTRYNNLAGGAVNVTVDGINDASNGFKSGGTVFFMTVPVRLGAVDELTVETGGLGADSGAQSGANIKFTTKRGGSQYHGSAFYEPTTERFNANTFSRNAQNLPRVFGRTHNYGGNFSGPLVPIGSFKDKMFVFINFERAYSPITNARTVSVMTPEAQRGIYTYVVSGTTNQTRTANVLALAAAKGLPTKLDPVSQQIIAQNNQVPQFAALIPDTDLNRDTYTWLAENNNYAYFPTVRYDYHVTPKQQVTFTWNYRHNWQAGERRLPVPDISRTNPFRLGYFVWSAALQSTFSPRLLNEFRYGVQHSGDSNASDKYGAYYQVNGSPLRIGSTLPFGPAPAGASQGGVVVPFIDQQNVTGRHFITPMYDTATLSRGEHTYTFGGSFRRTVWNDSGEVFPVPTYALGTPSGDPLQASQAFTTTTMPGINNTELGSPLALYNTLVGRVAASNLTRVVNPETLKYDGFHNFTWTNSLMGGVYAQDRWRITPTLTLNYGLRWEIQGPMKDGKGITAAPDLTSLFGPSTKLFTPGALSGNNNPTVEVGRVPYKTDWLNFAPNLGFAWNPSKTEGWMGKLFGDSKTVIRGSWAMIVYDEGTQFFAANLGPNAGKTINATTLVPGQPGQTNLPAFYTLSNIAANPLTASSFAFTTTEYKKVINQADQTFARAINGFDPTLRAPYTVNWTLGIQRELTKDNILEIRYVGNQTHQAWRTSNLNEVNIFENGFLQEFKNAQKNLAINQAAGVQSFQNRGLAGQAALPIFDAAFGARGGVPAIAAGSGYASTGFITNLQNGAAGTLANTLATNNNYVCRMFGNSFSPCTRIDPRYNAAGVYPINFFLLNPFVSGRMNYIDDTGWHNYNGLQVEFRQRFANSLNWTTNYTWSKSLTNLATDNQNQSIDFTTLRFTGNDRRISQFDSTHVIQSYGTYELPVGRGRWLSVDNAVLDGVIGGWTLGSVFVFQTGVPVQLTGGFDTVNAGNNPQRSGVRLAPGVTLDMIQQMFNAELTRITGRVGFTDLQRIGVDPRLIGPDGRANPQFLLPNTTPGEFGDLLFIRDRNTFQWDISINKTFNVTEQIRFQIFAGMNNVLNHPRWGLPDTNVFNTTFGIVGAPTGSRSM